MSLQPIVCILINFFQFIHHPIKLYFISSFGYFPKQVSNQNTRMVLLGIVVEMSAANPMLIFWSIVNKSLHQPLQYNKKICSVSNPRLQYGNKATYLLLV